MKNQANWEGGGGGNNQKKDLRSGYHEKNPSGLVKCFKMSVGEQK